MNKFFIEKVGKIRSGMTFSSPSLDSCKLTMRDKHTRLDLSFTSVKKVEKVLRHLSNSKSTAADGLNNYSVKLAAPFIAAQLHHIVTLSLMQQRFPSSWKFAKVIPLQKNLKLSPLEMKNYRPVAILSPISKVLEKIIYEQMYEYFTRSQIFHKSLHGYRHNRSTQTALLQMYHRWVQAANAGCISGAVLLDMSAAFDLVPHDLLIRKLEIYGLEPAFLEWIKSYLLDRHQGVWIDHTLSTYLPCDVGVPQGSILGPLFFLIFVNDMPNIIENYIEQYADDSTLTAIGQTIDEVNAKLEYDCHSVKLWMEQNQLKLNPDKTHVLTIGTDKRLSSLDNKISDRMDGIELQESADGFEYLLGCYIQSNLKWKKQVTELAAKLKKRLIGLVTLKHILPKHLRKIVAEGTFNSVLGYCLPLFGGCNNEEIKELQVLQNKAAQIVIHAPPRTNRVTMYEELDWLTVNQLVKYHTLLAVYRIRLSGEPEYLKDTFRFDDRRGNLILPKVKLSLFRNSFVCRGILSWNSLPRDLREIAKISVFKKRLRSWIKQTVPKFLE